MFTLELVDKLTFERAERHLTTVSKTARGNDAQQVRSSYLAGGALAEQDATFGQVRSATQVIEYGLGEGGLDDFDAVSIFLAGYYHRMRWLSKS